MAFRLDAINIFRFCANMAPCRRRPAAGRGLGLFDKAVLPPFGSTDRPFSWR